MPDETSAKALIQSIRTRSAEIKASVGQRGSNSDAYSRGDINTLPPKLLFAAEHLSLKVLRDSLISEHTTKQGLELEGPEGDSTPKASKPLGKWTMASAQARYGAGEAFKPTLPSPYAQSTPMKKLRSAPEDGLHSDRERPANKVLTGKDLVLICRQNSLIPVVLGLACKNQDRLDGQTEHEHEQNTF
jgi:hypothetical protein